MDVAPREHQSPRDDRGLSSTGGASGELRRFDVYVCDAYRTNWVFVRIENAQGVHGWGEATLEHRELVVAEALRALEPGLRGRDLANIEAWWQDAYRDAYWRGGAVLTSAISAVEMALWDIKGKELGVPVWELLGGRVREQVPCYANAWFADARSAKDFAEAAKRTVAAGYRALKWDPFGTSFRSIGRQALRESLSCVAAVRSAVPEDVELIIEGHGRFELPSARALCRSLESLDIAWIEEPLIPGNMGAYADLRHGTSVLISAGERLYTRWDFREALEIGALDVVQPDVSHAGGIAELRRIAAMAEMWQLAFSPHNPSGPVANAATLQLAALCSNFTYLETMTADVPWRGEVASESLVFRDGHVLISGRPGLGVDLDIEALNAHPYEPHPLRHYDGRLTAVRPTTATVPFRSVT